MNYWIPTMYRPVFFKALVLDSLLLWWFLSYRWDRHYLLTLLYPCWVKKKQKKKNFSTWYIILILVCVDWNSPIDLFLPITLLNYTYISPSPWAIQTFYFACFNHITTKRWITLQEELHGTTIIRSFVSFFLSVVIFCVVLFQLPVCGH